jgi:S-adenosylhomocysteine hydrolase
VISDLRRRKQKTEDRKQKAMNYRHCERSEAIRNILYVMPEAGDLLQSAVASPQSVDCNKLDNRYGTIDCRPEAEDRN